MFSTLPKTNSNFSVSFILLSTNVFNLDQSRILSSGKKLFEDKVKAASLFFLGNVKNKGWDRVIEYWNIRKPAEYSNSKIILDLWGWGISYVGKHPLKNLKKCHKVKSSISERSILEVTPRLFVFNVSKSTDIHLPDIL